MSYARSNTKTWPVLLILGVTAFLQQVEGFVYFAIFWKVYRHEKTIWPFLTEKSIKSRRKRNALTMMSQVYIYVMELVFISSMLMITANNFEPGIGFPILVQIEFAIRNTVQALASSETRGELVSLLRNIRRMCWLP